MKRRRMTQGGGKPEGFVYVGARNVLESKEIKTV